MWLDAGIKISPNFLKLATKVTKVAFYYKVTYFKIAEKVSKYLGHFNDQICCLELSKIAQSGHNAFE